MIECADCKQEFTFTEGEQEFYAEKGFSDPKRCKDCRQAVKRAREERNGGGRERRDFEVTCDECGKATTVPFKPTQDRPVYCRDCFQDRRG
jgi:CxxC-x17-CxxC domain-containing protein